MAVNADAENAVAGDFRQLHIQEIQLLLDFPGVGADPFQQLFQKMPPQPAAAVVQTDAHFFLPLPFRRLHVQLLADFLQRLPQLRQVDGLDQVVHRPQLQGGLDVLGFHIGAHDQQMGRICQLGTAAGKAQPIDIRHPDIRQQQIRLMLLRHGKGGQTAIHHAHQLKAVGLLFKEAPQPLPCASLVVCNQQLIHTPASRASIFCLFYHMKSQKYSMG